MRKLGMFQLGTSAYENDETEEENRKEVNHAEKSTFHSRVETTPR
jgi:hypothetical protein